MQQLSIIFTLLLLVSCGRPADHMTAEGLPGDISGISVELSAYVQDFEESFKVTVDYPVIIQEDLLDYSQQVRGANDIPSLPSYVDAVCWSSQDGTQRLIEVRRTRWEELSDGAKEQLILHELGHCSLDRDHDATVIEGTSCKTSIMNPYTFSESEITDCYKPRREYYLDELGRPE